MGARQLRQGLGPLAKGGRGVGAEPCSVVCRADRAVFVRWGYAAFLQNAVLVLGKETQGVALGWYVLPLRGNGWSQGWCVAPKQMRGYLHQ
jgi:hypothetical protein